MFETSCTCDMKVIFKVYNMMDSSVNTIYLIQCLIENTVDVEIFVLH